jgi:hypothetical protein
METRTVEIRGPRQLPVGADGRPRRDIRHSAASAELVGRKVGGSSGLEPAVPTPRIVLPDWIANALLEAPWPWESGPVTAAAAGWPARHPTGAGTREHVSLSGSSTSCVDDGRTSWSTRRPNMSLGVSRPRRSFRLEAERRRCNAHPVRDLLPRRWPARRRPVRVAGVRETRGIVENVTLGAIPRPETAGDWGHEPVVAIAERCADP